MLYLARRPFALNRKGISLFWIFVLGLGGLKAGSANGDFPASELIDTNAPEFTVRTWTTQQGLPGDTVTDFCQTRDGYIWVGTMDGLARFDGVKFACYGVSSGLPHAGITTFLEDEQGALWIGTERGLAINEQRFHSVPQFDLKLTNTWITALAKDQSGQIWIGSKWGMYRCADGQMIQADKLLGLPHQAIDFLYTDHSGVIWAWGNTSKLFRIKNDRAVALPAGYPLPKNAYIRAISEDQANRLWLLADTNVLFYCKNGLWENIPATPAAPLHRLHGIAETADGTLWLGSHGNGLFYLRGNHFLKSNNENIPPKTMFKALWSDHEGNLWGSLLSGGLISLHPALLTVLAGSLGLTNEAVHAITETVAGKLIVGTEDGVYHETDGHFEKMDVSTNDLIHWTRSVLVTHANELWWGADTYLLDLGNANRPGLPAKHFISLPEDNNVLSLCEDRQTNLWVGTMHGLMRLQAGQLVAVGDLDASNQIQTLALAPDGSICVGDAKYGVFLLRPGQPEHYTMSDGLKSDSIRTLYFDAFGALWIGTRAGGLSRLKDGKIFTYTTRNGLVSDTISQIFDDEDGNLWLGSNRGISRVRQQDLNDLAAGKITRLRCLNLGKNDGMLAEECSGGSNPAALKAKSGLLFFSTFKGIVVVNPKKIPHDQPPPSAVIEEIHANDNIPLATHTRHQIKSSDLTNGQPTEITLQPGENNLEIRYTGLHSVNPEAIIFRYQLIGYDEDWKNAGNRRYANYTQITPGHYTFCVEAANLDGHWNPTATTLRIYLRPKFYQTWTFKIAAVVACALGLICSIYYKIKRQVYRRLRLLEMQHTLENERQRIAHDLHDELGARLTSIAQLGELAVRSQQSPTALKQQVDTITVRIQQLMDTMNEVIWAINPKNDSLPNIVAFLNDYTERFLALGGVSWRLEIDANFPERVVSAQARHNFLLAAKETLNNAVRHANATLIQLDIHVKNDALEVTITDNGRGFALDKIRANSNGLSNIQSRLASIQGRAEIKSQPGHGTTVTLFMPLTKSATQNQPNSKPIKNTA